MGLVIDIPPSLADALFPKVRQRVLAILFGTPDRSFYANEVIALAQSGTGAVQRELADLMRKAGVVSTLAQAATQSQGGKGTYW